MTKDKLIDLAERISNGQASTDEISEYLRITKSVEAGYDPDLGIWQQNKSIVYKKLEQRLFKSDRSIRTIWLKMAIASSIIIFLGISTFFLLQHRNDAIQNEYAVDFKPGIKKAILVLANGKKIVIDSIKTGILAREGGMIIQKDKNGQIVYRPDADYKGVRDTNSIITPRGAEHQVILADGTHVWLNAESTLKFPVAFDKESRQVKLTGEAYFEVTKDQTRPFRVVTDKQTIEVHGTHFNIHAYGDEQYTTTTLLEGSVLVINKGEKAWLKPGEECRNSLSQKTLQVRKCKNPDEVIAWKNGMFSFDNAEVKDIMKQVGRWYDVDVEYKSEKNNYHLSADFSRNMNASKVLKILNYTGLKFKTEDKKIIVE